LGTTITVKVTPGARKSAVIGMENGILKVHLHAAPEKGAANKELLNVLSEYLKVSKRQLVILKGTTSRIKVIEISP
jgi:uncharacterized protein (TIGR00251 family)